MAPYLKFVPIWCPNIVESFILVLKFARFSGFCAHIAWTIIYNAFGCSLIQHSRQWYVRKFIVFITFSRILSLCRLFYMFLFYGKQYFVLLKFLCENHFFYMPMTISEYKIVHHSLIHKSSLRLYHIEWHINVWLILPITWWHAKRFPQCWPKSTSHRWNPLTKDQLWRALMLYLP